MNNLLLCLYCLLTLLVSLFVNWFLLRYSGNKFAKNAPTGSQRWETKRKPTIGGISFMVGFVISILFFYLFWTPLPNIDRMQTIVIIGSIAIAFILGLFDDLRNAPVPVKFALQFFIAIVLIIGGISIHLTNILWIDYLLTIFWIVGIMNSLNMLDNMDAVTASVSTIILFSMLFLNTIIFPLHKLMIIGFIFAIIGFLRYNVHPSKMYMGDVGSLTLGCTLSVFSILYLWNGFQEISITNSAWVHLFVVILVFIVPLTDTTTVFIKRIAKKQSPFVGDKGHTTHHLVYAGWSQKLVAPFYAILTLIGGICAYFFIHNTDKWQFWLLTIVYIVLVFAFLFGISLTHTDKE